MAGKATNELLIAFGTVVRTRRLAAGLTQEALAESAGLHTTYVSDVERGLRNVGLINIDRLAQALSTDLDVFMHEVKARRA